MGSGQAGLGLPEVSLLLKNVSVTVMRLALSLQENMSTVWPVMSHHSPHYCFSFGTDHTLISGRQLSPLILPCAQASVGIMPGIGPEVSCI